MTRNELKPNDRANERRQEKNPPKSCRFLKYENPHEYRSYSTDSSPDGVGCPDGQTLRDLVQQEHADRKANEKTHHPKDSSLSRRFFGLAQTGGKTHFEKSGDDE